MSVLFFSAQESLPNRASLHTVYIHIVTVSSDVDKGTYHKESVECTCSQNGDLFIFLWRKRKQVPVKHGNQHLQRFTAGLRQLFPFLFFFLFHLQVYMCTICVPATCGGHRRASAPLQLALGQSWAAMWMLRIKPRCSLRATNNLNH